jgi:hypothetical protein
MMTLPPPTHANPAPAAPQHRPAPPPTPSAPPLRALIKKELRQNLPLAACIAAALILLSLFVAYATTSSFRSNINVLLFPAVAALISFATAATGFALGLAQPLHENAFDLWALRVHRPVSRSLLFAGRLLAGLILYAFLIVLPTIVLILIATTSAGGLFFRPAFASPALADLLNGLLFYLAGLLCAQRHAFLLGSRGLPLLFALTAAVVAARVQHLSTALLLEALAAFLLLIAAHGSDLSHGYTLRRPRPRAATPILALTLLVAISAILILLTGPVRQLWIIPMEDAAANALPAPTNRTITTHLLLSDGTLGTLIDSTRGARQTTRLLDAAGHERPQKDRAEGHIINLPPVDHSISHSYRDPASSIIQRAAAWQITVSKVTTCYAVGDNGVLYAFTIPREFNPDPSQYLGTLGPAGLAPPGSPIIPFRHALVADWFTQHHPTALYTIDLYTPSVNHLFTAPPGEEIRALATAANTNGIPQPTQSNEDLYLIATDKHLTILDTAGHTLQTLPITHDLTTCTLALYAVPESKNIILWYQQYSGPADIETYDPAGKLLSKESLSATQTIDDPDAPARAAKIAELQSPFKTLDSVLIALANPILQIPAAQLDLTPRPEEAPPFLPLALTLIASALLTLPIALRYRLRALAALWTLLALLTGPAALLTLIAIHTLPRKVRCKTCNAWRHPTQSCPNHHTPDQPPPPSPTEILT